MFTERDLERFVSILSKQGLTVKCQGVKAYTDGKTVVIPTLPPNVSDETIARVRFFIDHEVGHIIGKSQMHLLEEAVTNYGKAGKSILNVVEDRRIEQNMTDLFAGSGLNIGRGAAAMVKKQNDDYRNGPPEFKAQMDGLLRQFIGCLYTYGRAGMIVPDYVTDKVKQVVQKYETELAAVHTSAKSTADIFPLAVKLIAEYRKMKSGKDDEVAEDPQPEQQGQQPQQQPAGQMQKMVSRQAQQHQQQQEADDVDDDTPPATASTGRDGTESEQGGSQADNAGEAPPQEPEADPVGEPDDAEGDEPQEDEEASEDSDDAAGDGTEGEVGGEAESEDGGEGDGDGASDGSAGDGDSGGEQGGGSAGDGPSQEQHDTSDDSDGGESGTGGSAGGHGRADQLTDEQLDELARQDADQDTEADVADTMADVSDQIADDVIEQGKQAIENKDVSAYRPISDDLDVIEKLGGSRKQNEVRAFKDEVKRNAGPARQRLLQLLLAEARVGWARNRTRGYPDPRNLHKLAANTSTRVMRRAVVTPAMDTACFLLVDGSSSMCGGTCQAAADAAAVFCEVLAAAGHACRVGTFVEGTSQRTLAARVTVTPQEIAAERERLARQEPGYAEYYRTCDDYIIASSIRNAEHVRMRQSGIRMDGVTIKLGKDWNESYRDALPKLYQMRGIATGGTPMGQAMQFAGKELARRPEQRKVMMVFGDGGPNSGPAGMDAYEYVRQTCKWLEKMGIEVVLIGIHTDAMTHIWHKNAKVMQIKDLAKTTLKELAHALHRG